MITILRFLYQWIIAFPILLVDTAFTAFFTLFTTCWNSSKWVFSVQAWWARMFCYLFGIRVTVDGLENIEENHSYVFVANHQSMYDIFAIYGWLPVVFKWVMKQELRKVPFIGFGCQAAGHIFIERGKGMSAMRSLEKAKQTLQGGVSIVIFPEGTRSHDGQVSRFKRGAFSLATQLDLPVVPISLSGCYEVLSRKDILVHRHPIHLHVDRPIMLREEYGSDDQKAMEAVRAVIVKNKH